MSGIVRTNLDQHVGHASASPAPFHQTKYATGSPTVYINNERVVRKGDTTYCGDPAIGHSPTVFCDGIPVHRKNDATDGHASWVPNKAETGSDTVFAEGK